MKTTSAALLVALAMALCTCLISSSAAQYATPPLLRAMPQSQDQPIPPQGNPDDPNQSKTFTGKIIQSGDKLVLTDATGEAIYQLDDQEKARAFLNKNVKVTGILDATTKLIHVSDIEPV